MEFEDQMNSHKKFAENGVLRRLYRIITMPTADIEIDGRKPKNSDVNCKVCMNREEEPSATVQKSPKQRLLEIFADPDEEKCSCKGYVPISHKSVHFSTEKYRDMLIQLLLMCREA